MKVVEIAHEEKDGGEVVLAWGVQDGMITIQRCLKRGEVVTVKTVQMTAKEFNALDDYEGEC